MSWLPGVDEGELFENPAPQPRPDRLATGDPVPLELAGLSLDAAQDRVAIVMVGLPACGKTHLARRIARYLEFFHSVRVQTFSVADYRRTLCGITVPASFYDAENAEGKQQLENCWLAALADMKAFITQSEQPLSAEASEGMAGRVGFLDGLHLTRLHRSRVKEELDACGVRVIFIESITSDPALMEFHFAEIKKRMPDYRGVSEEEAFQDFTQRVENLRKIYEEVDAHGDEEQLSWVKITNLQTFVINRVRTYLSGRIVQFLLNLHPRQRTIYLSRHGQSEYNALGKVGGDSNLTARGREYAKRLSHYAEEVICRDAAGRVRPTRLWTSTLQRTKQTAAYIKHPTCERDGQPFVCMRGKSWTNLDEIYAGICDGMTYEEIKARLPEEAARRSENKLSYRYPRGESYMDLIQRLEPIVHELERHEEPLLVIGHQAVLRIIYCYLKGIPREEAPRVSMPLHTIVKMQPHTYDCDEERIQLMLDSEGNPQDTPSH